VSASSIGSCNCTALAIHIGKRKPTKNPTTLEQKKYRGKSLQMAGRTSFVCFIQEKLMAWTVQKNSNRGGITVFYKSGREEHYP